jgi:hypothetical protein
LNTSGKWVIANVSYHLHTLRNVSRETCRRYSQGPYRKWICLVTSLGVIIFLAVDGQSCGLYGKAYRLEHLKPVIEMIDYGDAAMWLGFSGGLGKG